MKILFWLAVAALAADLARSSIVVAALFLITCAAINKFVVKDSK